MAEDRSGIRRLFRTVLNRRFYGSNGVRSMDVSSGYVGYPPVNAYRMRRDTSGAEVPRNLNHNGSNTHERVDRNEEFVRQVTSNNPRISRDGGGPQMSTFLDFDPITAVRVIHGLLLAGFIHSLSVIYVLYILTFINWTKDTMDVVLIVLHLTLYFHIMFQMMQFPNRMKIFEKISECKRLLPLFDYNVYNEYRERVATIIREIEHSEEWKRNQYISTGIWLNAFAQLSALLLARIKSSNLDDQPRSLALNYFTSIGNFLRFGVSLGEVESNLGNQRLLIMTNWLLLFFLLARFLLTMCWSIYHYYYFRQRFSNLFRKGISEERLKLLIGESFTNYKRSLQEACVVCLTPFEVGDLTVTLPCNEMHIFHEACVKKWLVKSWSCPLCMANVSLLLEQKPR